jgi:hypothetical protein
MLERHYFHHYYLVMVLLMEYCQRRLLEEPHLTLRPLRLNRRYFLPGYYLRHHRHLRL